MSSCVRMVESISDEPLPIGVLDLAEVETYGLNSDAEDALEALCAWVEGDGSEVDVRRLGQLFARRLREQRERYAAERMAAE